MQLRLGNQFLSVPARTLVAICNGQQLWLFRARIKPLRAPRCESASGRHLIKPGRLAVDSTEPVYPHARNRSQKCPGVRVFWVGQDQLRGAKLNNLARIKDRDLVRNF